MRTEPAPVKRYPSRILWLPALSRDVARRNPRVLVGVAAVLTAFIVALLYSVWLPREYSGDDLQYATVIQQAIEGTTLFHPAGQTNFVPDGGMVTSSGDTSVPVNPRYLLEWPTSVAVVSVWEWLGWSGDVVTPVLALRIATGAAGILFFFLAVRSLSGDTLAAMLASLGLATTVAYWTYSTHLDQSINMIAMLCVALYLAARRMKSPDDPRVVTGLALSLAIATLYNFTGAIPAVLVGIFVALTTPAGGHWMGRIKEGVRFYAIYGTTVLIVLVVGVALLESPSSVVSTEYWKAARFAGHPEYDVAVAKDAFRSGLGFAKAQIGYPRTSGSLQEYWDVAGRGERAQVVGYYGVVLSLMLLPIGLLWLRRRDFRSQMPMTLLLAGLIVGYGLFNWWWDPGYIKYWLIPLMAWWAMAALVLGNVKKAGGWVYPAGVAMLLVFIVATLTLNTATIFRPQSETTANEWLSVADELKASEPNALFISAGSHPVDFHISFFTRRDIVSTGLIHYSRGGTDHQFVGDVISRRVESYRAAGAPIYLYGLEALPSDTFHELMNIFDASKLRVAWVFDDLTIYEYVYDDEPQAHTWN